MQNIEEMFKKATLTINEHIDMLVMSNLSIRASNSMLENYLIKRGYSENYALGKPIMLKEFVNIYINEDKNYLEIWHGVPNEMFSTKPLIAPRETLTNLPYL